MKRPVVGTGRRTIAGIGELVDMDVYCRLVRERCGHVLELPNFAGVDGWVRRHHGSCLECARLWSTPPNASRW